MLLPEELKEPEIPYRFLRSFLEFLAHQPKQPYSDLLRRLWQRRL